MTGKETGSDSNSFQNKDLLFTHRTPKTKNLPKRKFCGRKKPNQMRCVQPIFESRGRKMIQWVHLNLARKQIRQMWKRLGGWLTHYLPVMTASTLISPPSNTIVAKNTFSLQEESIPNKIHSSIFFVCSLLKSVLRKKTKNSLKRILLLYKAVGPMGPANIPQINWTWKWQSSNYI